MVIDPLTPISLTTPVCSTTPGCRKIDTIVQDSLTSMQGCSDFFLVKGLWAFFSWVKNWLRRLFCYGKKDEVERPPLPLIDIISKIRNPHLFLEKKLSLFALCPQEIRDSCDEVCRSIPALRGQEGLLTTHVFVFLKVYGVFRAKDELRMLNALQAQIGFAKKNEALLDAYTGEKVGFHDVRFEREAFSKIVSFLIDQFAFQVRLNEYALDFLRKNQQYLEGFNPLKWVEFEIAYQKGAFQEEDLFSFREKRLLQEQIGELSDKMP